MVPRMVEYICKTGLVLAEKIFANKAKKYFDFRSKAV
jgi:hypothetical protein